MLLFYKRFVYLHFDIKIDWMFYIMICFFLCYLQTPTFTHFTHDTIKYMNEMNLIWISTQ